jgi:hypothetical protein
LLSFILLDLKVPEETDFFTTNPLQTFPVLTLAVGKGVKHGSRSM